MTDSHVTLVGNATRQPEIKFLPSGMQVVEFGLAVNRRWKNRQTDQWEEQTSFFDVTAFGQLGENVAESVPSGTRVVVTGRLQQESWEKDGQKRSKVKIVADEVAPSLRWATAQVTRIERQAGGGGAAQPKPAAAKFGEEPF